MAYTPKDWNDGSAGGTPIDAVSLDNIETGIFDAHVTADATTLVADAAAADGTQALADAAAAQAAADAAAVTADAAFPVATGTTKGDIFVCTGPGVLVRLPIGDDGEVLLCDSGEASGLRWGQRTTADTVAPLTPNVGDVWLDIS